jgi:hypothetical protein
MSRITIAVSSSSSGSGMYVSPQDRESGRVGTGMKERPLADRAGSVCARARRAGVRRLAQRWRQQLGCHVTSTASANVPKADISGWR